jgi:hypothetical protein
MTPRSRIRRIASRCALTTAPDLPVLREYLLGSAARRVSSCATCSARWRYAARSWPSRGDAWATVRTARQSGAALPPPSPATRRRRGTTRGGGVRGQERQRDLDGQVGEPCADVRDQPADRQADRDPFGADQEEPPDRRGCRRRGRRHRGAGRASGSSRPARRVQPRDPGRQGHRRDHAAQVELGPAPGHPAFRRLRGDVRDHLHLRGPAHHAERRGPRPGGPPDPRPLRGGRAGWGALLPQLPGRGGAHAGRGVRPDRGAGRGPAPPVPGAATGRRRRGERPS